MFPFCFVSTRDGVTPLIPSAFDEFSTWAPPIIEVLWTKTAPLQRRPRLCGAAASATMRMAFPLSAKAVKPGFALSPALPGRAFGLLTSPASLSPILLICIALILALQPIPASASSAERKQQARQQFEKAEQMREALNGRPADQRTRKDYMRVADAYRKVYYVAPASSKADASVIAVAEVLADMGRQFQPGDKDLRAAIGEYEFLRREYPGSKYRFQALFTIGQIYREDLGDEANAKLTFEEFLHHYPRHPLAREARQALAELNRPPAPRKPAEEARAPEKPAPDKQLAKTPADEPPDDAPAADVDDSLPALAAKKKAPLALVT